MQDKNNTVLTCTCTCTMFSSEMSLYQCPYGCQDELISVVTEQKKTIYLE